MVLITDDAVHTISWPEQLNWFETEVTFKLVNCELSIVTQAGNLGFSFSNPVEDKLLP
jgi:hypothetical protein